MKFFSRFLNEVTDIIESKIPEIKLEQQPKIEITSSEIHADIEKHADELVTDAKKILDEAKEKDIDNAVRVRSLGFFNVESITELAQLDKEKQEAKKTIDLYNDYENSYPNNIFLTEIAIKRICKKYGLYFANARYFTGTIPQKNIKEIAEFKPNDKDLYYYIHSDDRDEYGRYIFSGFYNYDEMIEYKKSTDYNIFKEEECYVIAPIEQFNTENKTIENDYKIIDNDPIVLFQINGGYLVISKWGNEESIKELSE